MGSSGGKLTPTAAAAAELVRLHRQKVVLPEVLEHDLAIPRSQAISLLKELAEAGYGEFVLGRKGGATRLEKSHLAQHGRAADSLPLTGNSNHANEQIFLLQRAIPVKVIVPADLTSAEADRISKWLKAIIVDD